MDKLREHRKKYDPFWDIDPIELRCGLVETIDLLERTSHYLKDESTDQPFSPFFRLTEQRPTLARFDMLDRGGGDPAPPWPSLGGIEVILTGNGSRVTLYPDFRNIHGDNQRRARVVHGVYNVMLYTFSNHEMLSDPDLPNRFYRFWHGLEDVPKPAAPRAGDEQEDKVRRGGAPAAELVKPDKNAPLDRWFDYYHACKSAKRRYTLKELAADVLHDDVYIRQKHLEYKAEHIV